MPDQHSSTHRYCPNILQYYQNPGIVPKGNTFIVVSVCGKSLQRVEEIRLKDDRKGIGNGNQGGVMCGEVFGSSLEFDGKCCLFFRGGFD